MLRTVQGRTSSGSLRRWHRRPARCVRRHAFDGVPTLLAGEVAPVLTEWLMRLVPRRLIGSREISLPWDNYSTREHRRELKEAARQYELAEAPIVERLRREGLEIAALDDLVNDRVDYRDHES